jgi:hypothetical protein
MSELPIPSQLGRVVLVVLVRQINLGLLVTTLCLARLLLLEVARAVAVLLLLVNLMLVGMVGQVAGVVLEMV